MSDKLLIPISIIIAGGLVGGSLYFSKTRAPLTAQQATEKTKEIRPVTASDHLLGNPKARVIIVEYSDPECPFCKEFQKTMQQIVASYGAQGQVAWVYRHLPLVELHSKGPKEAEALECAGELGGNAKFWEYTNRLYEVTPANDGLESASLIDIAKQVGLNSQEFSTCYNSGKYADKIQKDIEEGKKIGAEGTPYSVIVDTKTGDTYPFPGAQPFANLKSIIDLILQS